MTLAGLKIREKCETIILQDIFDNECELDSYDKLRSIFEISYQRVEICRDNAPSNISTTTTPPCEDHFKQSTFDIFIRIIIRSRKRECYCVECKLGKKIEKIVSDLYDKYVKYYRNRCNRLGNICCGTSAKFLLLVNKNLVDGIKRMLRKYQLSEIEVRGVK